jgi:hypothetical protein
MAELKTKKTNKSVSQFIKAIDDPERRKDCESLSKLMKKITGAAPKMWGAAIVGFGDYRYKYASGREGDWFPIGFSPRKQALTIYAMCAFAQSPDLLKKLGKYKMGKGCLYIKRLADIDQEILTKLLKESIARLK